MAGDTPEAPQVIYQSRRSNQFDMFSSAFSAFVVLAMASSVLGAPQAVASSSDVVTSASLDSVSNTVTPAATPASATKSHFAFPTDGPIASLEQKFSSLLSRFPIPTSGAELQAEISSFLAEIPRPTSGSGFDSSSSVASSTLDSASTSATESSSGLSRRGLFKPNFYATTTTVPLTITHTATVTDVVGTVTVTATVTDASRRRITPLRPLFQGTLTVTDKVFVTATATTSLTETVTDTVTVSATGSATDASTSATASVDDLD
ncbi:hypothetical protein PUNSTDRAFT_146080 [Punctularia strigosozonata HHB-11173 SS5]|uniref:Uncharacterized protein n=1 Tax=Punctularia strigosozonata (strain HHB-11173) TaxID=741275 RepID=R7S5E8_PUNST|nr:uncharacterized protein PUNSTDRAFT_146080 [Punctularia strigosozonata HHB-11173 SS5]EIN05204.1 hypothetical protein PUNSTDRAFT_146080 [Punctularia strigosozonata HHB-11173 SS5]